MSGASKRENPAITGKRIGVLAASDGTRFLQEKEIRAATFGI
jgi:hypothetical protein